MLLLLLAIFCWVVLTEYVLFNALLSSTIILLLAAYIYYYREYYKKIYASRKFNRMLDVSITLVLLFLVLSLLNYWSFKHPLQKDFSLFRSNEITDQSKKVLKNIDRELNAIIVGRKIEILQWKELLEVYRVEKSSINISIYDSDARPDILQKYNLQQSHALILEYNGLSQVVYKTDELNLTNAIIKLTRTSEPVVYFVTGHGEADLNSVKNDGMKYAFEMIKQAAINVRSINLSSIESIPFDAKLVVILGPKTKFMKRELSLLKNYLDQQGNLLLALDPNLNGDVHSELRELMYKFGINIRNDLVIDLKSYISGSNGTIPLFESLNPEHPIGAEVKGQVFFPLTSSVDKLKQDLDSSNHDASIQFLSSTNDFPESWGESSAQEVLQSKMIYTPTVDIAGPMHTSLTYQKGRHKMAVFGNSTFAINAYQKYGVNFLLLLNTIHWLTDEDKLMSFDLPIIQSEKMFVSKYQLSSIFFFSVLIIPLLCFGLAFVVYRKKQLG